MPDSKSPIEIIEQLVAKRRQYERFAMLYIHNAHMVQDIVSESYVYLWEHRDTIDFGGNLEAYLFNVVKHRCLDHLSHTNSCAEMPKNECSTTPAGNSK